MKSLFIIIITLASVGMSAEARQSRAERREQRQDARIQNGADSGSLTASEQRRLKRGQNRVEHAEAKAEADGTVTAKEKAKIEKMQDVQSKRIYRQKHDGQNAPPPAAPAEGQ